MEMLGKRTEHDSAPPLEPSPQGDKEESVDKKGGQSEAAVFDTLDSSLSDDFQPTRIMAAYK